MPDYRALIERLEKASGPDRELDFDICVQFGLHDAKPSFGPHLRRIWRGPPLTTSIDAALALVPEADRSEAIESVFTYDWSGDISEFARRICVFQLRALQQKANADG